MSDAAAVPAAAEPATPATGPDAPRTMPASAPTPAPDAADANYTPEQDDAAGFAAFRAAKGEPPTETAAAPATPEAKADVVAAAVADATGAEPPAAPPAGSAEPNADPSDAKLNKIFNRIAHLERERDEARSSLSRLEARAARADELERQDAEFRANPKKALERLGWTPDTLAEFVLKGNEAVSPQITAVEQETRALKEELANLRRERQEAERETKIRAYVAEIPKQLKDELSKLPHLSAYYESPTEMAEAVWSVQRNAYQQQKTELSPVEAAHAVEKVLAEQAKRFQRASSQSPASSNTASTPKPPAAPAAPPPTLTNRATSAPRPGPAETDDTSPNYAAAIELMRAARK